MAKKRKKAAKKRAAPKKRRKAAPKKKRAAPKRKKAATKRAAPKKKKRAAPKKKKKAAKRKIGFSQFAPTPMNPDPFNITEEPMYLNDFSLFAKFNEEGARKRNVFFAILVAFSLGLGGSLTASYIDKNNLKGLMV